MTGIMNILSASVILTGSTTLALPPISSVPEIDAPMLSVAMAIEIADKCDTISQRTIKGINVLWSLKQQAEELGYSRDEIKAYIKSDAEVDRLRALGEAYVRDKGYDPMKAEDLCALGREEIAANTLLGSLLRAK